VQLSIWDHTKIAELIEMSFVVMTRVGHRHHVLDGGPYPVKGRGSFEGKHKKYRNVAAIRSPITICSRKDHSVSLQHLLPTGLARKGVMGVHSMDEM